MHPKPPNIDFETLYAVVNRAGKDASRARSSLDRLHTRVFENHEAIELATVRLDRIEDHQTRQLELLAAILVRLSESGATPASHRE